MTSQEDGVDEPELADRRLGGAEFSALDPQERMISLNGRLTINEAEDRLPELIDRSGCDGPITLETSGLEAIDIAGLQLLLALRASVLERQGSIRLASPPVGALLNMLVAAGFCELGTDGDHIMVRDPFWRGGD